MIKTQKGSVEMHGSLNEMMADYYVIMRAMRKALVSSFTEDSPVKIGEKAADMLTKDWLKGGFVVAFMSDEEFEKEAATLLEKLGTSVSNTWVNCIKGGGDITHG